MIRRHLVAFGVATLLVVPIAGGDASGGELNDGTGGSTESGAQELTVEGGGGAVEASAVVLLREDFDTWPPTGWTTPGKPYGWAQCDGCTAADCTFGGEQLRGATGPYAVVDDDCAGADEHLRVALRSPAFDCTGLATVELSFVHSFMDFDGGSSAVVEVSTDGTTYTEVANFAADTPNPDTPRIDISDIAADESSVTVRFVYDDNHGFELFWMIDTIEALGW